MIKNLAQLKKSLKEGLQWEIVENAIKPENNKQIRTIKKIQSNAILSVTHDNKDIWLYWQKAKNMKFNNDNTIDFLLGEEMKDNWLIEQQEQQGKNYWLKIKLLEVVK